MIAGFFHCYELGGRQSPSKETMSKNNSKLPSKETMGKNTANISRNLFVAITYRITYSTGFKESERDTDFLLKMKET